MAALLSRRRGGSTTDPNSLTAAGQRINQQVAEEIQRLSQPWQYRSLDYYRLSGPAWYAGQFYARMLKPLRLYAAEKDDEGNINETENEEVKAQLDRIQDPGGGRGELQAAFGRLYFLTGEARLLCSVNPDTELEQWEMLSVRELRMDGDRISRYRAPSTTPSEYRMPSDDDYSPLEDKQAVAYRLWRRHPEFSDEADAPMRAVLDDFEELLLLTRAVRARARSRLAGPGMLFIDEKISARPPEPVPGEDLPVDKYYRNLMEAMMAGMAVEGAASEVVPILSRVPVPENKSIRDMVYHLQIIDPVQLYPETGLRMEVLRRISIGLDLPSEVLTGLADVNHWTGWLVDESTWKGHGEQVAVQLCSDLTESFFLPTLKANRVANWNRYLIWYDDSAVVNHPDRSKDAKDLHRLGVIGDKALRASNNFKDEDAPTEDERRVWLSVYSRDPGYAETGIPSRLTPASGEDVKPTEGGEVPDVGGGGEMPAEAPKAPPSRTASANGHSTDVTKILGASELALLRCRQAAGARLLSLAKRDPRLRDELEGITKSEIAATLGRERVKAMKAPAEVELVKCAGELFDGMLRAWGIEDREVAHLIAEQVEQHAARTLYESRSIGLPQSLLNYIAGIAQGLPAAA